MKSEEKITGCKENVLFTLTNAGGNPLAHGEGRQ
jgi:hypothetical protein